jgi:D-cysteine desulfhydrase
VSKPVGILVQERAVNSYPTPELFRFYPELRERMPWVPLARATPVERLSRLESFLHAGSVWAKRDDRTSDLHGGDAARKLEFLFGEILRSGARRIVAFGGVGSPRCLAITAFAHQFEIHTVLALARRRARRDAQRTLEIEHDLGAELHRMDGGPRALWRLLRSLVAARGEDEPRLPYFVWPRRAAVWAALGYVNAVLELKRQINVGLLPEPEFIYVPAATGTTAAGLWLGCHLAELQSTVVAVASGASRRPSPHRLATRALARLRRHTRRIPDGEPRRAALVVRREFGAASDVGSAAAHHAGGLARDLEQLELDPDSGQRAMAALIDDARNSRSQGPVLFWHTRAAHRFAPQVSADALPREFREFFVAQ